MDILNLRQFSRGRKTNTCSKFIVL